MAALDDYQDPQYTDQMVRFDRNGNVVPVTTQPPNVATQAAETVRESVPAVPPGLAREFRPALDPNGAPPLVSATGENMGRPIEPRPDYVGQGVSALTGFIQRRYDELNKPPAETPRDDEYMSVNPSAGAVQAFINKDQGGSSAETRQILRNRATEDAEAAKQPPPAPADTSLPATLPTTEKMRALEPTKQQKVVEKAVEKASTATTSSQTPAQVSGTTAKPPEETEKPKGGAGVAPSATRGRQPDEHPEITPKATISPRAYVELAKTDPALYENITQVAAHMGVGPWDLTNLVFAASNGDPNSTKNGRVGLTGLLPADIERYKQAFPNLFVDRQGNALDAATDPHLNLILGAMKYREVSDLYGARTPSAIAAYYLGPGRVNQLSTMTPKEQNEHTSQEERNLVGKTVDPDSKGDTPSIAYQSSGTMTPTGSAQAAVAAAKAGNPQIYATYMVNNAPRGMSSNDMWSHAESLGVYAMLRAGDVQGAQRYRELIFQMSHVGSNTALMDAHKQLAAGDNVGAAQSLARAYFYAPDGGYAKFHVTSQGVIGQRYNEQTNTPIGAPFQVTPEKVAGMINITQDPQTYLKTLQESQKTNADVEYKKAHGEYLRGAERREEIRAGVAERRDKAAQTRVETQQSGALDRTAVREVLRTPPGGNKLDPAIARTDRVMSGLYPSPDAADPEEIRARELVRDIVTTQPAFSPDRAKEIGEDLARRTGKYRLQMEPGGRGRVVDAKSGAPVVYLTPGVMPRQQQQTGVPAR